MTATATGVGYVASMSSINFLRLDYEDPVLWDVHVDVLKRRISKLRKLSELGTAGVSAGVRNIGQKRHSSCPSPGPLLVSSPLTRDARDQHVSVVQNRKLGRRYGQSFQADHDGGYLRTEEEEVI